MDLSCLRFFTETEKEENILKEFLASLVESVTNINGAVNNFVWGIPMLVLLVGTGILMTDQIFPVIPYRTLVPEHHRRYFQG